MNKVYEIVTEKVLAAMAAGNVPWRKPWKDDGTGCFLPMSVSMSTRRPYRGVNVFLLAMAAMEAGYKSKWWGTYEQIQKHGGQVRKGAKSTLVIFWKRTESKRENEDGDEETRRGFMLRYFSVFNAEQADWTDECPEWLKDKPAPEQPDAGEAPEPLPIEKAESIVSGYEGAPPIKYNGSSAFYSPSKDIIGMPQRKSFGSPEEFYSTLFHEMTHSTGHAKRVGRDGVTENHFFGDEAYSKEELVAEMGAAFLCAEAGIENAAVLENSAAYLRHWTFKLKQEPKLVVQAAAQAQRAVDHVLGRKFEKEAE
jgi:antirestriction protein ArdC